MSCCAEYTHASCAVLLIKKEKQCSLLRKELHELHDGKSEIMSRDGSISTSKRRPTVEKEKGVYVQKSVTDECGHAAKEVPSKHVENFREQDTDLDSALEEAAKRRNLTTLNVKSIIHVSSTVLLGKRAKFHNSNPSPRYYNCHRHL